MRGGNDSIMRAMTQNPAALASRDKDSESTINNTNVHRPLHGSIRNSRSFPRKRESIWTPAYAGVSGERMCAVARIF
jgi:hypothetical protein